MPEPTFDQIEAYLADTLSDDAKADFEARCQADPVWAEATRLHLLARQALHVAGRAQLKARLDQRFQGSELPQGQPEDRPSRPTRALWQRPWLYVAAAAAIALLWLIRSPGDQPALDGPQLYAMYQELPGSSATRGAKGDTLAQRWVSIDQALQGGEFAAAIDQLSRWLADSSLAAGYGNRIRLYLGVAQLEGGQPMEAQQTLATVEAGSLYAEEAQWYQVLAWLRADQASQALPLLQAISQNQGHYRQRQAEQILDQLAR
jgi:hypothetical protein